MSDQDSQFADMEDVVQTLFSLSCDLVAKNGNFLPHGAVQTDEGDIELVAAAGETEITNSEEILPLLQDGLRSHTGAASTRVAAVSESVFLGPKRTAAIKVLVEHKDGLTVAFYQPWAKRFLKGPEFGEIMMREADPEIGGWARSS